MELQFLNIKKLGLGIVAFEGTEHLYNIISEVKDYVNYITVALLKISYHGEPIEQLDIDIVNDLYKSKLIDNIVYIDLDNTKSARLQETDKRNLLLDILLLHNCSHSLIIDSDEFYTHASFSRALNEIDNNDYDVTYCLYINYYHDYNHVALYPFKEGMYVPFVSKSLYRFQFDSAEVSIPSDPTRRYILSKIKNTKFYIFPWETVKMHHFSWIRNNIRKKLNTWSSKKLFNDYNDLINQAVLSYNNFDMNKQYQDVMLLFNTPNKKITIKKLDRTYIHPIRDIKYYITNFKSKQ